MWRSLRWECAGETIVFGEEPTSPVFMDLSSFYPYLVSGVFDRRSGYGIDGTQTYNAALSSLRVPIKARVLVYNQSSRKYPVEYLTDEYTAKLCRVFDPRRQGRLIYETNTGSYFISGHPESLPAFENEAPAVLKFAVDVVSDYPYWQSTDQIVMDIGTTEALLSLPGEITDGMESGEIITYQSDVPNNTSYSIYPIIRFWPCNSIPLLTNTDTGKSVSLNRTVPEGYYVDVDTAPERNTVTAYRLNEATGEYEAAGDRSYWVSLGSNEDFSLEPGKNHLVADNITAGAFPAVTLLWRERYLGV